MGKDIRYKSVGGDGDGERHHIKVEEEAAAATVAEGEHSKRNGKLIDRPSLFWVVFTFINHSRARTLMNRRERPAVRYRFRRKDRRTRGGPPEEGLADREPTR